MPSDAEDREIGRWYFRPQVSLAQNPLFQWPPKPPAILRWCANFLTHFLMPSHPLHVLFHGDVQPTHPVFYYQLHHRCIESNYGTVEMPWDRWFGSDHDCSAQAKNETRTRKKQMYR